MPRTVDPRPAPSDTPAVRLGTALGDAVVRLADARDDRPLLTWVDAVDGSRIELSAATAASWISKVGGLLLDEHDPGSVVGLDLAGHWTAPLIACGAWRVGCAVAPGATSAVDLLVAVEQSTAVQRDGLRDLDLLVVGPGPTAHPADAQLPSFAAQVLAEPDELVADRPDAGAVAVVGREPAVDMNALVAGLAGLSDRRILVLDPLDEHAGLIVLAAAIVHRAAIVGGRLGAADDETVSRVATAERVEVLVGTAAQLRASEAASDLGRVAVPWPPHGPA